MHAGVRIKEVGQVLTESVLIEDDHEGEVVDMVLEGEVGNNIDFLAVSPKRGNPATICCSQGRRRNAASISALHGNVIGDVEVRVGYVEPI